MTTVWVFPGQGAQRIGMGAEVLDRYPELLRQADEILGYRLREVCLEGAEPGLKDTRSVQPALFVVNALSWLAMREEHPAPDYLAGHSLGEYDALFAAGCFDFATGVRLVQRRGELMGRAGGGGMTAVVGVEPDRLAELLAGAGIDDVDLANRNSAEQVVLAGPLDSLRRAAEAVRAAGSGRCVPLQVSAPFHSRYMGGAAEEFGAFLAGIPIADPRIPVIANVTALPYGAGAVKELLARQVAAPVRWWESMSHLLDRGVTELVEVGPGRVLTDLWKAARRRPAPAPAPVTPAAPVSAPAAVSGPAGIRPEQLGSAGFRADYGLRYAYLAGAMFKGVASVDLVVRMGRAGLMGFFGTGGLTRDEVAAAILAIRERLGPDGRFGMNLLADPDRPAAERELVELYLRHDVRHVEAAAFTGVTPALVRYRFAGAHRTPDGTPVAVRHVLAKVSRPEVATAFMSPPPARLLDRLVAEGALTPAEAEAATALPVAGEVCVEADSGGHTDAGSPYVLLPAMLRLRDTLTAEHGYRRPVRVGAAGGIGAPESVAASFVLGADFVLTGSVNQCSPEAGTSEAVKELLATIDVQDTAYAPAGDMFELGARVQVVRKSTLFPARANKLHQVYRRYEGLDEIDEPTRRTIEDRYFRRSFAEVWAETEAYLREHRPDDLARAERSPKARMAQVFRWYFVHSTRAALGGVPGEQVNYQIHCGPAMGAFNRAVAGTPLQAWRERHVDAIAETLMTGAAELLDGSLRTLAQHTPGE
ncbi:ACP S-malonyltransferase [Streptomyces sp. 1331.2]|uniref:ACP S-malonyltransferase n=1 Tax=Streptomyces sp. 1331.2 TaxID=1938835 RepID=UPI000BCD7738|nr:ACP S-malonyltransferase [Streptomyces sp. 1331.2]SOB83276.1 trans-AT polyketide synthase, acyltransferase and oxidoreductase domain-containing protein [Streptomyces sp. 1331.2]